MCTLITLPSIRRRNGHVCYNAPEHVYVGRGMSASKIKTNLSYIITLNFVPWCQRRQKNPKSDFLLHCSRAYIYCRTCLYPHLQQTLSVHGLVIWSTSSAKVSLFVTNESLKCFVLKVLMLPPLCISFDFIIPTPLFLGGRIKVLYCRPLKLRDIQKC